MPTNLAGSGLPAGNGGVVFPSPNEWPITVFAITNITRSPQPIITAVGHGLTNATNQSTPQVDFSQVKGMTQINGQFAYVTNVIDDDNFTISLNTSSYYAYTSGGYVHVLVGPSPIDPLTNTYP